MSADGSDDSVSGSDRELPAHVAACIAQARQELKFVCLYTSTKFATTKHISICDCADSVGQLRES